MVSLETETARQEIGALLLDEGFGALTSLTRLTGGVVNQVFRVGTPRCSLVVRTNSDCLDVFRKEEWAMRQAEERGVNVPSVFFVGERRGLCYMVMSDIRGQTLDKFDGDRQSALVELGRQIRLINSVAVDGFGFGFDRAQKRFTSTWHEVVQHEQEWIFGSKAMLLPVLGQAGLAECRTFLAPMYDWNLSPRLCHGDINPGNVIVADDGRVFIIDWTLSKGGPAALYDLSTLSVSDRAEEFAAVCRGWGISDTEREAMLSDLHRVALTDVLRAAAWAYSVNHPELARFQLDVRAVFAKTLSAG